jgi:hypothetical protein
MHTIDDVLDSIATMNGADLDRLQAAIDGRRQGTSASSVVERRSYRDGILQLEYRTNPKTGKQRGPYWYFKHRVDGRQRTIYVGATDDPIAKLSNERKDRAYEVES